MKIGKQTFKIESRPCIYATSSIVGPKEMQGPLANYFDLHIKDVFFDEKTFEKAESKMLESCINNLLVKAGITDQDIDKFVSDFNDKYRYKIKLTKDVPAFITFEDGEVTDILEPENDKDKLTMDEVTKYLKVNKIGE